MADEKEYIVQDGVVIDPCTCEPVPPKLEKIKVEQVIAAGSAQRVLEINAVVPPEKPPIEQVIKMVVKNLEVTNIKVITNKVIITGEVDVKVLYVAQLPDQPVHAIEIENYKFTKDIALEGITADMHAEGDAVLEYSDYEFECEKPHHHHKKHDSSKHKTSDGGKDCHHHPYPCDRRQVRLTLVIKVWVKVFDYVEMEVMISPLVVEEEDGTKTVVSASDFETDTVSAEELKQKYEEVKVAPISPVSEPATATGTATVTANNVNVRSGPGVNFPVVAKVSKGKQVTLRETAFGWYRVTFDTTDGWIAGWLLKKS
jgi:hypothetical protein